MNQLAWPLQMEYRYKFWISSWPSSDINVFYAVIIYQITRRWYLITLCIPLRQKHSRCIIIRWGWSTYGVFVGNPTPQIYILNKRHSKKELFFSLKIPTHPQKYIPMNKEKANNPRKSALTKLNDSTEYIYTVIILFKLLAGSNLPILP